MQGILTSRNAAIAVVLLLVAGFLLTRYLGRRMGAARRNALGQVNRVLCELATAMHGRFEEGPQLTDHPLLGQLRQYGTAHLILDRPGRPLAIDAGVSYPADDLRDDRTTVLVRRPADRRWRVTSLHQRRRPAATIELGAVDAELARCFEITAAGPLPPEAREALLQVGARAFSLDLEGGALTLIADSEGKTVYIADVPRLKALVEEVTRLAELLLA